MAWNFEIGPGGGGVSTCYVNVDLIGGVPPVKVPFLSPISIAKGLFLARFPQPRVSVWMRIHSQGYIFNKYFGHFDLIPAFFVEADDKIWAKFDQFHAQLLQKWLIWCISYCQGFDFGPFFIAILALSLCSQGYGCENLGHTPHSKFFGVPPGEIGPSKL